MKIYYLSDIHNDYSGFNYLTLLEGDSSAILVVAGDINSKGRSVKDLEEVADRWKYVIAVAGNHDYWGLTLEKKYKFDSDVHNVKFLCNETIAIDGITFVGTTLWHPIKDCFDELLWKQTMYESKKIRGKNYSKLQGERLNEEHLEAIKFIESTQNIEGTKILVTHHALCDCSIGQGFINSKTNKFYVTHKPDLLEGFKYHIHGHIHSESDYDVYGCNVLCNPVGYLDYTPSKEDAMRQIKIIETGDDKGVITRVALLF